MPYRLKKVKGGYKVVSIDTGREHSKHPMSKEEATAQLAVLNIKLRKGEIQ